MGVQYYTGHATPGEHVIVRREPQNPYDPNALRVENVQRDQIGHIPRTMASKLAKYMVMLSISPVSDIPNGGFRILELCWWRGLFQVAWALTTVPLP